MQENKSGLDLNADYSQILPIQQKRTIAFVNHFIINTVSFLNHFAKSCESRLMEFENKLQNVEASLLILESQLNSIPGLDENENKSVKIDEKLVESLPEIKDDQKDSENVIPIVEIDEGDARKEGPTASEDIRFKRFFKMLQFGVPPPAVKLKMQTEGIDPNILDTPTAIIPGGSFENNEQKNSDAEESD